MIHFQGKMMQPILFCCHFLLVVVTTMIKSLYFIRAIHHVSGIKSRSTTIIISTKNDNASRMNKRTTTIINGSTMKNDTNNTMIHNKCSNKNKTLAVVVVVVVTPCCVQSLTIFSSIGCGVPLFRYTQYQMPYQFLTLRIRPGCSDDQHYRMYIITILIFMMSTTTVNTQRIDS